MKELTPDWKLRQLPGFATTMGPMYERDGVFALPMEAKHVNTRKTAHGGLAIAFADQGMGWYAQAHCPEGKSCTTIQLDSHLIGLAREGDIMILTPKIEKMTRSLFFMTASLEVEDRLIGTFHGVWKILNMGPYDPA
ncbi:MAG: PaaI family thioesterase [Flavobacteriaceae bacterium]